ERAQLAFIKSERVRGIEAEDTAPAERAAALVIERESIAERRAALDAEIIGAHSLRLGEAGGANTEAGEIGEGPRAKAAFIGKDQGKKASGDLLAQNKSGGRDGLSERTTAEDDTP